MSARPTLAVWKFSSCDGCQLSLLDCEDELLAIAEVIDIASFAEATSAVRPGPYDVSLVEGSITTAEEAERIRAVRAQSGLLVAIGSCATSGGIQALRNLADVTEWIPMVYPSPEHIETLATSTAIRDHVRVDIELRGCPVSTKQLVELVAALINGRRPRLPAYSVCIECKARGTTCVMVAGGTPCLGPVTMAGCGAICPAYARGCYGCFGPSEAPNVAALAARWRELGVGDEATARALRTFNANAPAFREAADDLG